MLLLFKKENNAEVPKWAAFFSPSQYTHFVKKIHKYFDKLNVKYSIEDGIVKVDEEKFGFTNLGLSTVAQVCNQEKKRNYKSRIKEHFNSMIESKIFQKEFDLIVDNFEEVKKYIGVRLYHNTFINHIGKEFTLGIKLFGDVYGMLVFDLPHTILSVQPDQIKPWGKSFEELFEIGKQNIKTKYPIKVTPEKFGKFSFLFVNSSNFFTPNIVFDLDKTPGLVGSKGSIIGLPHRHSILIYPIENLEVADAMNGLARATYGMNQEGPGSLTNKLFWYYNNTFTEIPYNFNEEGGLSFKPPTAFIDLLNTLEKA